MSLVAALQITGFSSFTNLAMLSMANNKLGEAASFELPSLVGLLAGEGSAALGDISGSLSSRSQQSVMFPMLQVLRLHDNSIRSIQGLQLFGFTGELL